MEHERGRGDIAGAVDVGENDLEFGLGKNPVIDDRAGGGDEIGVVGRTFQGDDAGKIFVQKGPELAQLHGVDLGNDAAVVGGDDLRTVLEVGLEAVVVRRIVA